MKYVIPLILVFASTAQAAPLSWLIPDEGSVTRKPRTHVESIDYAGIHDDDDCTTVNFRQLAQHIQSLEKRINDLEHPTLTGPYYQPCPIFMPNGSQTFGQ